ncbi:hypothetical protein GW17_00025323 [Ensete ventricosum]|nr:hypothetical protein GW17_00025323 [Ensete ventricosum]
MHRITHRPCTGDVVSDDGADLFGSRSSSQGGRIVPPFPPPTTLPTPPTGRGPPSYPNPLIFGYRVGSRTRTHALTGLVGQATYGYPLDGGLDPIASPDVAGGFVEWDRSRPAGHLGWRIGRSTPFTLCFDRSDVSDAINIGGGVMDGGGNGKNKPQAFRPYGSSLSSSGPSLVFGESCATPKRSVSLF